MSKDFAEMLETTASTDEALDVDMPFLEAYRRGGSTELHRVQAQASRATPDTRLDEPGDHAGADHADPLRPDQGPSPREPERPAGSNRRERSDGTGGAAAGAPSERVPVEPTGGSTVVAGPAREEPVDTRADVAGSALPQEKREPAAGAETPASLRLTDHQEAVQSAVSAKGGSGGAEGTAALPQSGFRISGVKSQPHIRSLPDAIVAVLREHLRSAAVRELGVSDTAARDFSQRLSQGTLVTAFLMAQLDVRIDADAATARAAELFRSGDPLLGSVAARLEELEAAEHERDRLLHRLLDELGRVRETNDVIEQAVAYSIADRTENFLRGSHDIRDAPITHKDALFVRDKVRDATRKQAQLERERAGRPMR
ncbi:hypothetical protein C8K30_1011079 [Promicromonospora sp. AC04]|uniref:hypothetical protein n=1 Tax=Promicromonospora sp. AC04 TaxID=2135723 RepID=UPI000D3986C3|nr:hypothetical protein [Promicromonospora sp. AC04]PUB32553.1 hypothetical protein C8K30_1011079 [Promicromonospora sp. AC04]